LALDAFNLFVRTADVYPPGAMLRTFIDEGRQLQREAAAGGVALQANL
jgi:hypothetical protein